ncbi:unnamed protein product [Phaeothamnion confervicola]
MSGGYITLLLGVAARCEAGRELINASGSFGRRLIAMGSRPELDYLSRQVLTHLDYGSENFFGREALQIWMTSGSRSLRLYATNLMRLMLRPASTAAPAVTANRAATAEAATAATAAAAAAAAAATFAAAASAGGPPVVRSSSEATAPRADVAGRGGRSFSDVAISGAVAATTGAAAGANAKGDVDVAAAGAEGTGAASLGDLARPAADKTVMPAAADVADAPAENSAENSVAPVQEDVQTLEEQDPAAMVETAVDTIAGVEAATAEAAMMVWVAEDDPAAASFYDPPELPSLPLGKSTSPLPPPRDTPSLLRRRSPPPPPGAASAAASDSDATSSSAVIGVAPEASAAAASAAASAAAASAADETADDFERWGIDALVTQLYFDDPDVTRAALSVLEEAAVRLRYLRALVSKRPDLLGKPGAAALLMRFLAVPEGVSLLTELGWLPQALARWRGPGLAEYAAGLEAALHAHLTDPSFADDAGGFLPPFGVMAAGRDDRGDGTPHIPVRLDTPAFAAAAGVPAATAGTATAGFGGGGGGGGGTNLAGEVTQLLLRLPWNIEVVLGKDFTPSGLALRVDTFVDASMLRGSSSGAGRGGGGGCATADGAAGSEAGAAEAVGFGLGINTGINGSGAGVAGGAGGGRLLTVRGVIVDATGRPMTQPVEPHLSLHARLCIGSYAVNRAGVLVPLLQSSVADGAGSAGSGSGGGGGGGGTGSVGLAARQRPRSGRQARPPRSPAGDLYRWQAYRGAGVPDLEKQLVDDAADGDDHACWSSWRPNQRYHSTPQSMSGGGGGSGGGACSSGRSPAVSPGGHGGNGGGGGGGGGGVSNGTGGGGWHGGPQPPLSPGAARSDAGEYCLAMAQEPARWIFTTHGDNRSGSHAMERSRAHFLKAVEFTLSLEPPSGVPLGTISSSGGGGGGVGSGAGVAGLGGLASGGNGGSAAGGTWPSAAGAPSAAVPVPPHLYGQLALTAKGCALLHAEGGVDGLLRTAMTDTVPAAARAAALWALAHVAAADGGLKLVRSFEAGFVGRLAAMAASEACLSVRATAFCALPLVARTVHGRTALAAAGWEPGGAEADPGGSGIGGYGGGGSEAAAAAAMAAAGSAPADVYMLPEPAGLFRVARWRFAGAPADALDWLPPEIVPLPDLSREEEDILHNVAKLSNHICQKEGRSKLNRLKRDAAHKPLFRSVRLFLLAHDLLGRYRFSLPVRRFVLDLFGQVSTGKARRRKKGRRAKGKRNRTRKERMRKKRKGKTFIGLDIGFPVPQLLCQMHSATCCSLIVV